MTSPAALKHPRILQSKCTIATLQMVQTVQILDTKLDSMYASIRRSGSGTKITDLPLQYTFAQKMPP